MTMKAIRFLLLMVVGLRAAFCQTIEYDFDSRGTNDAIYGVARRVLNLTHSKVKSLFDMQIVLPEDREDWNFKITNGAGGKIQILGKSGPDLGYGLGWYLRTKYNMSFSWNRTGGHNLGNINLGQCDRLIPVSAEGIHKRRTVPVSYFHNVVTFSYSYVWYTFTEWEYLLDWMALSGINLALAYTGQEEIYRKTFAQFDVDSETFSKWCNGIAYLAWARGQNLHGCAGGLPLKVMEAQWNLQKQILKRSRSIGITSILPAFQGNVPSAIRDKFPDANFSRDHIAWLDSTDPLFARIQNVFLKTMIEDWGTDHWYETDGYFNHENGPWMFSGTNGVLDGNEKCQYNVDPTSSLERKASPHAVNPDETDLEKAPHNGETAYLTVNPYEIDSDEIDRIMEDKDAKAHSSAVFESISQVDDKAVWLYQGWIWRGWNKDRLAYMKGFLSGVPRGKFVMLDMFDEVAPEWNRFNFFSYFNTPFIWSVLQNFGGNTGMWGSLELLNTQPYLAYNKALSVQGIGGAPEGIDQNPVYYTMLLDVAWRKQPHPSVESFLERWTIERYGISSQKLNKAWGLLAKSVYGGDTNAQLAKTSDWLSEKNADGLTALPYDKWISKPQSDWYNLTDVVSAWKEFVDAAPEFGPRPTPRTFLYDLVNVGREAMAKMSNPIYNNMTKSNKTSVQRENSNRLLNIMAETDSLLCSESSFMTATWLEMAKNLAKSIDSEDVLLLHSFILQARSQISTWGPQQKTSKHLDSQNLDYANKQWGGSVGGFYLLREKCFKTSIGQPSDIFELCAVKTSYEWTNDYDGVKYPMCEEPSGLRVALDISKRLLQKYFK
mmetsp:Transcript_23355/g.37250  ORF Transcript_23355/g.37250 Transcript_23355/m.37250 type:complete len:831 (+) Transcript_23355:115-2607(+)